jgi:hypothetical protein
MGMKRSTIKMVIHNKLTEWMNTIDDNKLVERLKKDSIVSGGCITSMLLGEKVNDYDIYFRTFETAKLVAEYYVSKYNERNGSLEGSAYTPVVKIANITNIKGDEEERIKIFVKSIGASGSEEYVEGEENDFTNGTPNAEILDTAEDLVLVVRNKKENYIPIFLTDNAITLKGKIQLVIRFYGEPSEIHNNYDFAHCKCYYEYFTGALHLPADALESMLSKTLVYQGSLYPIASIFRTRKFLARGWRITAGQMLKMIWQVNDIDLTKIGTLREQLIGVDSAYMGQLLVALENNKSDRIDSTYLARLIDDIFE